MTDLLHTKRTFLIVMSCFINTLTGFAQDTLYFSSIGLSVPKEIAETYELGQLDTGSFRRYYLDTHAITFEGKRNHNKRISGEVRSYYRNGSQKEVATYVDNSKSDKIIRWYSSGQKEGDYFLIPYQEVKKKNLDQKIKTINQYDTSGYQLVKDGNGEGFELDTEGNITGRGKYINGYKDGLWEGELLIPIVMSYSETYERGKLITGTSIDNNQNRYTYSSVNENSKYVGGLSAFYSFLARNAIYPKKAQKKGTRKGLCSIYCWKGWLSFRI